ncbi:MAG: preprotein translocase subunit SecE [Bacillota bacterium]|nr:preprotein translocase subunit SecE [Bacillota bacterium]
MAAYGKRLQRFFHDVKIELKKVNWPSRRELMVFSSIVIIVIVVFGVFFWILDAGFTAVLKILI